MTTPLAVYDLARWKPITFAQYVDELGSCFMTVDEPKSISTKLEELPDGRWRLVTIARCVDEDFDGGHPPHVDVDVPYLMVLYQAEKGPGAPPDLCFKRTDVELWLP